jgi:hypothetical protein
VPNYLEVIAEGGLVPMDLGTIKKSMSRYGSHEEWAEDLRKVWKNAMYFNAAGLCPTLA